MPVCLTTQYLCILLGLEQLSYIFHLCHLLFSGDLSVYEEQLSYKGTNAKPKTITKTRSLQPVQVGEGKSNLIDRFI